MSCKHSITPVDEQRDREQQDEPEYRPVTGSCPETRQCIRTSRDNETHGEGNDARALETGRRLRPDWPQKYQSEQAAQRDAVVSQYAKLV